MSDNFFLQYFLSFWFSDIQWIDFQKKFCYIIVCFCRCCRNFIFFWKSSVRKMISIQMKQIKQFIKTKKNREEHVKNFCQQKKKKNGPGSHNSIIFTFSFTFFFHFSQFVCFASPSWFSSIRNDRNLRNMKGKVRF